MSDVPKVQVKSARGYIRNVHTRFPFKYGAAVLTATPIYHLAAEVEVDGKATHTGLAADCLPPKWFDKDPAKDYRANVTDLLKVIDMARTANLAAAPASPFDLFLATEGAIRREAVDAGLNGLTAQFGCSLFERAVADAVGLAAGRSYFALVSGNHLGIRPEAVHAELAGTPLAAALRREPLSHLTIRHTVGMADPLTAADVPAGEKLDDGLPQTLEENIQTCGIHAFKVKLRGDTAADLERVRQVAALLDRMLTGPYLVTLDGNEQYKGTAGFVELVDAMRADPGLGRFWKAVQYVEQPFDRAITLDASIAEDIRALARLKPLLIDESDESLDSFRTAFALGYDGVSSKNCKGIYKGLLNLALAGHFNATHSDRKAFLSGEDLMNVPVVPLHQDLATLSVLGVTHAERNGHHYIRGLTHLPASEVNLCLDRHGALYRPTEFGAALRIEAGRIDVRSLQQPGYGLGIEIDLASLTPEEEWSFDSLSE